MKYTTINIFGVFNHKLTIKKKRALIVDELFGSRIAILKEEITRYGETPTGAHTFLIELPSGNFHFQTTWTTLIAHKSQLTKERFNLVIQELTEKERKIK